MIGTTPNLLNQHHSFQDDLMIEDQFHKTFNLNSDGASIPTQDAFAEKLQEWLYSLGLQFNPFDSKYLDAGVDPKLASYLVGHESFAALWRDQPTIVFAPVGGGKTAFRVRLVRACRVGQDGRRILPVIYKLPSPTQFMPDGPTLEKHLHFLSRSAAAELFLALAYHPDRYFGLTPTVQRDICTHLQINLAGTLHSLLKQIVDKGTITPLIQFVDPTAEQLFTLPDATHLRALCESISTNLERGLMQGSLAILDSSTARFNGLMRIAREELGYESVYLLLDGVDAYIETVTKHRFASDFLKPLTQQMALWSSAQIYLKYFLPTEYISTVTVGDLLPSGEILEVKFIHIEWTPKMLSDLLQERLRVASEGRFHSLDAISTPPMRGIQDRLIEMAHFALPREVLVLAEQLLFWHIRRAEEPALLEPVDLNLTKQWYAQGGSQ